MNAELFDRLKKLANREGKVVFADSDDVFVILPLDEYEMMTDGLCGEECECEDHDFGEEVFANSEKPEEDEADKDLIKKVNEDIARWREEQANQEIKKSMNKEIKNGENLVDLSEVAGKPEAKEDILTEEERYYLEPLE